MEKLETRFNKWTKNIIEEWFGVGEDVDEHQYNVDEFIWYRGVSNYSYKLETGFQRKILGNSAVRELNLKQYYKKIGKHINKLVLDKDEFIFTGYENFGFAFLQHRGFPSPLLDWTSYKMVAAQFACNRWIKEQPETDAAIYALNVKKFMELFDIKYKTATLIFEDNIYDKACNVGFNGVPPLKVGPGNTKVLSEMSKPTPFQGFEPPYMSPKWRNEMERTIKDPLIARVAPQSGKFTYVPGKESLDEQIRKQCKSKGVKEGDIIQKFSIRTFEREEMKNVLEDNAYGDTFGDYIAYDSLFPEKSVYEIDKNLDKLRNSLNDNDFKTL